MQNNFPSKVLFLPPFNLAPILGKHFHFDAPLQNTWLVGKYKSMTFNSLSLITIYVCLSTENIWTQMRYLSWEPLVDFFFFFLHFQHSLLYNVAVRAQKGVILYISKNSLKCLVCCLVFLFIFLFFWEWSHHNIPHWKNPTQDIHKKEGWLDLVELH